MQIQNFDATGIEPQQIAGAHPPGTFPFIISNTFGQETKDKNGCMLCVVFTTQQGSITNRYNIFNASEAAVEIAKKQLSALCHTTGVFKLSIVDGANNMLPYDQWAREIRNARGVVEIGPQTNDPKYMEVKKVFDAAGNEPGKGPAAAPQPQQQAANGGWKAPQQVPAAQGWAQPNQAATQQPATQAVANPNPAPGQAAQGGWQPGPANNAAGGAPPWANK